MQQRKLKVQILRGRDGFAQTVDFDELLVGDVVTLVEGSRIPADCLLLYNYNIVADESRLLEDSKVVVPKSDLTNDNFEENPNPFLMQGTYIKSGFGTAIVCAVGDNTYLGK